MAVGEKRAAVNGSGKGRKQRRLQLSHQSRPTLFHDPSARTVVQSGKTRPQSIPTRPKPSSTTVHNQDDQDEEYSDEEHDTHSPGARLISRSVRTDSRVSLGDDDEAVIRRDSREPDEDIDEEGLSSLKRTIADVEVRIIAHMNMLHSRISTRVGGCESDIRNLSKVTDKVNTGLSDVRLLTLKSSASLARGTSDRTRSVAKKGKMSLKEEVEAKHPTLSHEMDIAFSPHTFCKACAQYFSLYMEACHVKQDDPRMTKRALSVIIYGLSKSQTKSEFKTGLGKKHADFRFKVAKNCLSHARTLSDDAFRHHEQLVLADLARQNGSVAGTATDVGSSVGKPAWLEPGIVCKSIMNMSRKFHECVKSELPDVPSSPDKKLALHIGRSVVNTVNDMLRRSRYTSKRKIFEAGFFLLGDWKDYKSFKPSIHSQRKLRFVWPYEVPVAPVQVPECHSSTVERYAEKNDQILGELIATRKEMILEASYSVAVISRSATERRRLEGASEVRNLVRHINIMRMALCFVQSYCFFPKDDILSVHPLMLRTVYRVALVLREFFIDSLGESERPPRALSGALLTLPGPYTGVEGIEIEDRGADNNEQRPSPIPSPQSEHRSMHQLETAQTSIAIITPENLLPSVSEMENHMMRVLTVTTDMFEKLKAKSLVDDDDELGNIDVLPLPNSGDTEEWESDEDLSGMLDDI